MMRKGPLDQYPLAGVLRSAAAERLSGSIEVEAEISGLLFFESGGLYLATLDGAAPPAELTGANPSEIGRLREHLTTVVAALLTQQRGWYHQHQVHQPLGRHPVWHRRAVDLEEVLQVATSIVTRPSLDRWSRSMLRVSDQAGSVCLDPEMLTVVAAMTRPTAAYELASSLGWDEERLAATFDRLAQAGLFPREETVIDRPAQAHTPIAEPEQTPLSPTWSGEADLRPRPLVTTGASRSLREVAAGAHLPRAAASNTPSTSLPSAITADDGRRSALRRLITSLRQ